MGIDRAVEMSDAEIRTFLDRGGTGVLSLADGDVPYATPVSYGFDPDRETFYLRLGLGTDSEKARFVEPSATARLVVYDRVADAWKSVIATGTLDRLGDDELTADVATGLREADLPLFELWEEPADQLEFELYQLDVTALTGRTVRADRSA